MSSSIFTDVDQYIHELFIPEDEALNKTMDSISETGIPSISVSYTQGKLLFLLAKMSKPKRILEIGTLAGFSTIWLARALPAGGVLVSLELEQQHADIALKNIANAGLADKVQILVGPAGDSLDQMISGKTEPFDFIFIDADKPPYAEYFRQSLKLSKSGTVIVADNVVREGRILDKATTDEDAAGIARFNKLISQTPEVDASILQTVGEKLHDGIAIAIVK